MANMLRVVVPLLALHALAIADEFNLIESGSTMIASIFDNVVNAAVVNVPTQQSTTTNAGTSPSTTSTSTTTTTTTTTTQNIHQAHTLAVIKDACSKLLECVANVERQLMTCQDLFNHSVSINAAVLTTNAALGKTGSRSANASVTISPAAIKLLKTNNIQATCLLTEVPPLRTNLRNLYPNRTRFLHTCISNRESTVTLLVFSDKKQSTCGQAANMTLRAQQQYPLYASAFSSSGAGSVVASPASHFGNKSNGTQAAHGVNGFYVLGPNGQPIPNGTMLAFNLNIPPPATSLVAGRRRKRVAMRAMSGAIGGEVTASTSNSPFGQYNANANIRACFKEVHAMRQQCEPLVACCQHAKYCQLQYKLSSVFSSIVSAQVALIEKGLECYERQLQQMLLNGQDIMSLANTESQSLQTSTTLANTPVDISIGNEDVFATQDFVSDVTS